MSPNCHIKAHNVTEYSSIYQRYVPAAYFTELFQHLILYNIVLNYETVKNDEAKECGRSLLCHIKSNIVASV